MAIGFCVSPYRLLWRALILARVYASILLSVRGGYLRLAISTPHLLVVLLEELRPLSGYDIPDRLDLELAAGPFEGAMAAMLMTRRITSRLADLVVLHDPGTGTVLLRCGLDFSELHALPSGAFPHYEGQVVDAISGPHLDNLNRYHPSHLRLLRRLLEPAGIRPRLTTSAPALRDEATTAEPLTPDEEIRRLDRAADIVSRSPGVYLDRNLIVIIQPDSNGVVPLGTEAD